MSIAGERRGEEEEVEVEVVGRTACGLCMVMADDRLLHRLGRIFYLFGDGHAVLV